MFIAQFIVIQVIFFVIIFLVLRRMLIKDTASAVNRLKSTDKENMERLTEMKKKIAELEGEYEKKKGDLPGELEKQRADAKKKIEEERERILSKAREEGKKIIEMANSKVDESKEEMKKRLQKQTAGLVGRMVKEVLSKTLNTGLNKQLVDEILGEVKTMEMGHVPDTIDEVEIVLSQPLGTDQMNALKEILTGKLKRPVKLKEKIQKEMSGGLILKMGSLVVDGSLDHLIQGAMGRVKME